MFNFETVWRKNRRLEGEVLYYQNRAKRDALEIMKLQEEIKNLEIELAQANAKITALSDCKIPVKPITIKSKTTKGKTK